MAVPVAALSWMPLRIALLLRESSLPSCFLRLPVRRSASAGTSRDQRECRRDPDAEGLAMKLPHR